uniref:Uncharacterized protein n=1 Tax=Anguilla anguilla TaxID=7936 RepID=A0A0E9QSD2_ANGAN
MVHTVPLAVYFCFLRRLFSVSGRI